MPPHQSAVSVLIQEVLSDPDLAHDDVFRRLLQAGLQDLIDAEATAQIGAGPYERSSTRSNQRNGKRPKWSAWCFSDRGSFSSPESIGWIPCQQRNTQTSSRPKWCVR